MTSTGGRYTILLADGSADDAFIIRRAFEAGHSATVRTVTNGPDVLSYFRGCGQFSKRRKHPLPDVLILSLGLPKKSAFDVLVELRDSDLPWPRQVVILASSAEAPDILRAHELGADIVAQKNTNLRRFVQRVNRAIAETMGPQELSPSEAQLSALARPEPEAYCEDDPLQEDLAHRNQTCAELQRSAA